MSEPFEYWLWLVKTNSGDFFVSASGNWTQEKAAKMVWGVFVALKELYEVELDIVGMIPRKRYQEDSGNVCSIVQDTKIIPGFRLYAGKKLWDICGRSAEYDAEKILLEKQW